MEVEEARQQEKSSKKAKKREKRKSLEQSDGDIDNPKDEKKKKKTKRKEKGKPTVSIAVAGSIVDNAQSLELATLVSELYIFSKFLLFHIVLFRFYCLSVKCASFLERNADY